MDDDFDPIANQVARHDLSDGLEEAFRSEQTPPFEQMVRRMFEHSDPDHPQRVRTLGQAALGIAMNRMAMRRR